MPSDKQTPTAAAALTKALVPPAWRTQRIHGQIPGRQVDQGEREARALLSQRFPKHPTTAQLFEVSVMRPQTVVSGMGLAPDEGRAWAKYLESAVKQAPDYLSYCQLLDGKAKDQALPDAARLVLRERASKLWNTRRGKGPVRVLTPDQLQKARDAEGDAPPAEYHRKVQLPDGKAKYFVSEQEYRKHPDAHLSSHDEQVEAASHALRGEVERAGQGLGTPELTKLAKRHGGKAVAQAVREGLAKDGHYIWHSGRLHRRTEDHNQAHHQHGGEDARMADLQLQSEQVAKARTPERFYLLEKATPIGGVTQDGYRRVAEDVYLPAAQAPAQSTQGASGAQEAPPESGEPQGGAQAPPRPPKAALRAPVGTPAPPEGQAPQSKGAPAQDSREQSLADAAVPRLKKRKKLKRTSVPPQRDGKAGPR